MKSEYYRWLVITFLTVPLTFSSCTSDQEVSYDYSNGNFISEMNSALTEAVIIDFFSPPVASRIYIYPNVAAYEVMRNSGSGSSSFAGRLQSLEQVPVPVAEDLNYSVATLSAFVKVGKELVYTEAPLLKFEEHKLDSLRNTGIDDDVIARSVAYGHEVADHILAWAGSDSYKETRAAERYALLNTSGSWLPTPPDYTPAMEPHWDELRTFVISGADIYRPDSLIEYSEDPQSEFYSMNMDVYNAVIMADSDQLSMAKFWDDNPAVTEHAGHMMVKNKKMTPGGHWIYITMLPVRDFGLDMLQASHAFSVTSVALADAFISCWEAKYHFQTIRPVTYINDHISSDWQPVLQTPPFPEYPSGHSAVSAAAATALTELFGDGFAFVDSSEVRFGLPVRSFNSFDHAAQEVALSRYYGGIHYTISNQKGSEMGREVGKAVVEKLLQ